MRFETASASRPALYDLLSYSIAPLPIALISTIGEDGVYNAAPVSFTAPVSVKPPIICVSISRRQGQKKHTWRNIEFSRDFVMNFVDETIIEQAIQASANYPNGVDEIREVGLTAIPGERVKSPRIAESKISLECRLLQISQFEEEGRDGVGLRAIIFGEVVLAHVKDEVWVNGKIDPLRLGAIGRLGKGLYCRTREVLEITEPYEISGDGLEPRLEDP